MSDASLCVVCGLERRENAQVLYINKCLSVISTNFSLCEPSCTYCKIMSRLLKISILSALLVALAQAAPAADEKIEYYSDKYDHIDGPTVLKNERLRNQYLNCFLDKAPCLTADAKFFKGF